MYKVLDVINEHYDNDVPLPLFRCKDTKEQVNDITYKHFMANKFTEQDYIDNKND